jgi:putative thiamine transport system ATP-binding protein
MAEGLRLDAVEIHRGVDRLIAADFAIPPGEVRTVMGPSGAGKSTLLAWAMGTLPPGFEACGRLSLGGLDLTGLAPEARGLGVLYQDPLLFPHLDVAANLAFGLPRGGRRATRRAKVEAALRRIGLEGFGARDPSTLSGGQAARVALMRVLLSEPGALLLDEPFSKLDADLRGRMRELVFAQARDLGLPVLMVTHDEADARAAGGPILRV